MAAIGKFVLSWVFGLLAAIVTAFVIRDCWTWFVVPLGMPSIGLAHALGLGYVGRLLTTNVSASLLAVEDEGVKKSLWWMSPFATAIFSLLCWGWGYLCHFVMVTWP